MATTYNEENAESADSVEAIVSVVDLTPPAPPSFLIGEAADAQVILEWGENSDRDVRGYNIYVSFSSGGPYSPLNSTPIPAYIHERVEANLNNGVPYYFVMTAQDMATNESAYTDELMLIPGP